MKPGFSASSRPLHPVWIICLFPALLTFWLYQSAGAIHLAIGAPGDKPLVEHFYGPEQNDAGSYRWSEPFATVTLPGRMSPMLLSARLAVAPLTEVVLHSSGRFTALLSNSEPEAALRRIHVLTRGDSDLLGWSTLQIDAYVIPSLNRSTDLGRALGLAIFDLAITPINSGLQVPAPLPLLLLSVIALLVGLFLRTLGVPDLLAFPLAALAGAALGAGWISYPLVVQPYLVLITVLAAVACGGVAGARHLISSPPRVTAPLLLALFVAVAGLLLLTGFTFYSSYWLIQWWQLPVAASIAALLLSLAGRRLRPALSGAIAVLLLAYGVQSFAYALTYYRTDDFSILFGGVQSFFRGGQLYNLSGVLSNHLGDASYKYPPLLALFMAPLTPLPRAEAALYWRLASLLLLLLTALLLWRWSGRPLRSWTSLGLIYLLLNLKPLADSLRYGQVDMLLLVGMAAALLALGRGRWGWWGACLALPAMLKLYPGYLIMHALVQRRWRGLAGFAAGALLLLLLSLPILGLGVYTTFVGEVAPAIGGGTAWIENQTFNGFFNRLAANEIRLRPDQPGPIHWLTYAAAGLLTLATAFATTRMQRDAGYGLWIVTMLLIIPAGWMHYQTVLIFPFYQLIVRLDKQPGAIGWRTLLLYSAAWALLCYGDQWTFLNREVSGPIWELVARGDIGQIFGLLLMSYKFYGLLLLWWGLASDPSAREAPLGQPLPDLPEPELAIAAPGGKL